MEVSVGDYGRMIFEMMLTDRPSDLPDHWASIKKEAEPLVRQLLALNKKMIVDDKPDGYQIHGYFEKKKGKKKKVLSDYEKIQLAQKQLLVEAGTLKEGDHFWLYEHSDLEMYINNDESVEVYEVTKKAVYFEMQHCGGWHTESISPDEKVLKAPDFYKEYVELCATFHKGEITDAVFIQKRAEHEAKKAEFESNEYWLAQYEKLVG